MRLGRGLSKAISPLYIALIQHTRAGAPLRLAAPAFPFPRSLSFRTPEQVAGLTFSLSRGEKSHRQSSPYLGDDDARPLFPNLASPQPTFVSIRESLRRSSPFVRPLALPYANHR